MSVCGLIFLYVLIYACMCVPCMCVPCMYVCAVYVCVCHVCLCVHMFCGGHSQHLYLAWVSYRQCDMKTHTSHLLHLKLPVLFSAILLKSTFRKQHHISLQLNTIQRSKLNFYFQSTRKFGKPRSCTILFCFFLQWPLLYYILYFLGC